MTAHIPRNDALADPRLAGQMQARAVRGWLWLVPLLFALSVMFVNGETPRFRLPVEPFLILLAACATAAVARYAVRQSAVKLGRPCRFDALSASK